MGQRGRTGQQPPSQRARANDGHGQPHWVSVQGHNQGAQPPRGGKKRKKKPLSQAEQRQRSRAAAVGITRAMMASAPQNGPKQAPPARHSSPFDGLGADRNAHYSRDPLEVVTGERRGSPHGDQDQVPMRGGWEPRSTPDAARARSSLIG